jgi:hypothetical protein
MVIKKVYQSFEKARIYAHSLKLKNMVEWQKLSKNKSMPEDVPSNPARYYKTQWKGWGDFLGTGNISKVIQKRSYRSFNKARKFARSLKLKTTKGWKNRRKAIRYSKRSL